MVPFCVDSALDGPDLLVQMSDLGQPFFKLIGLISQVPISDTVAPAKHALMQQRPIETDHVRDHHVTAFFFELDLKAFPFEEVAASADKRKSGEASESSKFPLLQCLCGHSENVISDLDYLWLDLLVKFLTHHNKLFKFLTRSEL